MQLTSELSDTCMLQKCYRHETTFCNNTFNITKQDEAHKSDVVRLKFFYRPLGDKPNYMHRKDMDEKNTTNTLKMQLI